MQALSTLVRHALRISVLALAPCVASSALAQTRANCEPGIVRQLTSDAVGRSWAPHLPEAVLAAHAAEISRGDYVAAISAVVGDADSVARRAGVPAATWDIVSARFDSLVRYMREFATVAEARQPRFLADSVRPSDFQLNQSPLTGNYTLFSGTPSQVVVSSATAVDVQRALCWPVIALDHILTVVGQRWRAETVANLTALANRWDNFLGNGYSQFPWELALNSALWKARSYEPPAVQWIVLHPSLGAELSGGSVKEIRGLESLVVEGLGVLRYNRNHTRYVGVAAVTTFANDANATIGIYAHLWFPQLSAGYVWRSDPTHDRPQGVVLSLDLYRFLARVPTELKDARDGALGGKLLSLTP